MTHLAIQNSGWKYVILAFALTTGLYCKIVYAADVKVLGLFKDMAILNIDGKKYMLRKGEVTPNGVKLISSSSDKAVLEIDGKKDTYTIDSQIKTSYSSKKNEIKKVPEARIWPIRGMYATAGSINDQPVYFLVDTGATYVTMNSHQAKRLGIDYRYSGTREFASTANGEVEIYLVNLDKVKVEGIELKYVKGAVIEGASPTKVLLGMSFLSRTKLQHQGEMMLLQKKW